MPTRNSAEFLLGQTTSRDNYFNRLARHISQFRTYSGNVHGRVVMRVTVARDGHLIDVRVDKSSGHTEIDTAETRTIRRASPFPPLPVDVPGDPVVFILPVTYRLPGSLGR
jgi:protein TonB